MKRVWTAASLLTGGVLGALAGAATFWAVTNPNAKEDQKVGAWSTSAAIGQAHQNPYTRARVALHGIWGLPPSEVVYFTASHDSAGERLRRACTYTVIGGPLPTRWWSLTLYRDGFYIDNPANRYSWSMSDTAIDANGRWTIALAPSGEGQNRLTFGGRDGLMQLLLRLYQPNTGVADHRDRVPLPEIRRVSCNTGGPAAASGIL